MNVVAGSELGTFIHTNETQRFEWPGTSSASLVGLG